MYVHSRRVDKGIAGLGLAEGACAGIERFDRDHDEGQKLTVKLMGFTYHDLNYIRFHAARTLAHEGRHDCLEGQHPGQKQ